MRTYDHKKIEKKWQKEWAKNDVNNAEISSSKPKKYILDMFPYPSGDGLHVGHVEGYTATDIYSRFSRMRGFNVLHPMGWDAFGLPAENYAIKTGIPPRKSTDTAIEKFKVQINGLGLSYDWSREIGTHTPEYYRWTQWLFLLLYTNGFAEKKRAKVNWCPQDNTVLANEQVVEGMCERCGSAVIQKDLEQWFFKTTKFADALHDDLDSVDWPESTKAAQRNWIGRSEGAEIDFKIKDSESTITVFTTRPDTLFGATYLVVAPEHTVIVDSMSALQNKEEVDAYCTKAKNRTDLERTADAKEKTGVELKGIKAIHPATDEEIPVYVADYVLGGYGKGAIMAVPAHDDRDYEFAQKFNLPVVEVVVPNRIDKRNPPVSGKETVTRKTVQVVVKNPKTKKILVLHSKKHGWNTFPMGGIEDGETVLDAARREVLEETGYKNLSNGVVHGGQVRAEFFATHKDENRVSFAHLVSFDLEDEKQAALSKDEEGVHEMLWMDPKELTEEFMVHAEMDIWLERLQKSGPYTGHGVLINSDKFDGLDSEDAKKKVTKHAGGAMVTTYRLRDWLISRQRYWGAPIPIVYDPEGKPHPVPEEHLPWTLPEDVEFKPTGVSPLGQSKELLARTEKIFGEGWKPEIDTMDTFVCSSWYYFRYADPKNDHEFASKHEVDTWLPVDLYVGGAEHTVLHLLYARFFTKVLQQVGYVHFSEPFLKLRHQGVILAEDGRKMSKSLGNVVNPNEPIELYGADTLRLFEMFMGPLDAMKPWNTKSIMGPRRFIERVWRLKDKVADVEMADENVHYDVHATIKKVTEDMEALAFNTAVSQLMILLNTLEGLPQVPTSIFELYLKLFAPLAPHVTEELWSELGHAESIHAQVWPVFDESKLQRTIITLVVQINSKVRAKISVEASADAQAIEAAAREAVMQKLDGLEIERVVHVPGRLVNFVIKT